MTKRKLGEFKLKGRAEALAWMHAFPWILDARSVPLIRREMKYLRGGREIRIFDITRFDVKSQNKARKEHETASFHNQRTTYALAYNEAIQCSSG
eukprot:scaffold10487_cov163-Skeletonema_marinoi.AAC.8